MPKYKPNFVKEAAQFVPNCDALIQDISDFVEAFKLKNNDAIKILNMLKDIEKQRKCVSKNTLRNYRAMLNVMRRAYVESNSRVLARKFNDFYNENKRKISIAEYDNLMEMLRVLNGRADEMDVATYVNFKDTYNKMIMNQKTR